jgi:hypothetical protein
VVRNPRCHDASGREAESPRDCPPRKQHFDRVDTVIRWCGLPGEDVPLVYLLGTSPAVVPNFLPSMTRPESRGRHILMIHYVGSRYRSLSESFAFNLAGHSRTNAAIMEAAHLLGYSVGGAVSRFASPPVLCLGKAGVFRACGTANARPAAPETVARQRRRDPPYAGCWISNDD